MTPDDAARLEAHRAAFRRSLIALRLADARAAAVRASVRAMLYLHVGKLDTSPGGDVQHPQAG